MPTFSPAFLAELTPDRVAALLVLLAHDSCTLSNETLSAYGRLYGRFWTMAGTGWRAPVDAGPDDLREHLHAILGDDGSEHRGDTSDFNVRVQESMFPG